MMIMRKRTWSYYKYLKSLLSTPNPLRKKKLCVREADYCGLIAYAKEKGVNVSELSLEEREQFVKVGTKSVTGRLYHEDGKY